MTVAGTEFSGVLTRIDDGAFGRVIRVTVNRAAKLNCLDTAHIEALRRAFEAASTDGEARAVVLTGAGERAFIGGADLGELGGLDSSGVRLFITRLHLACKAIRDCPIPTIARVNGFCLGAGLEVAASCDMRVASASARFGMPEVHMGLPSVIEAALLPGLIGWGKTRELLLTGEVVGPDEALAFGFVQKSVANDALDAAVDHWLRLIARGAPAAIRNQKALMNRWERVSVEEGVLAGVDAIAAAYETDEPAKAIAGFFAAKIRRSPHD